MDSFIFGTLDRLHGMTWPETVALIALCATAVVLAWMRLEHGDRDRQFWREATPEQIMARASTSATLPPPPKAPPSPLPPALLAILVAASLLLGGCVSLGQQESVQAQVHAWRQRCDNEKSGPAPDGTGLECSAARTCAAAAYPVVMGSPTRALLVLAQGKCAP